MCPTPPLEPGSSRPTLICKSPTLVCRSPSLMHLRDTLSMTDTCLLPALDNVARNKVVRVHLQKASVLQLSRIRHSPAAEDRELISVNLPLTRRILPMTRCSHMLSTPLTSSPAPSSLKRRCLAARSLFPYGEATARLKSARLASSAKTSGSPRALLASS